jgi:hypothetical protein
MILREINANMKKSVAIIKAENRFTLAKVKAEAGAIRVS